MVNAIASVRNDPAIGPFYYGLKAYIDDEKLEIPVLPQSAGRVLRLLQQPESDATELAEIIHVDPGLAATVLRVSNSPAYRGRQEVNSLRQAIARLGVSTLGKVVLSVTMGAEVFKARGFAREIQVIWRYSLAAGEFAQRISKEARVDLENSYLCGLLHAVGKPIVLRGVGSLQDELGMEITDVGINILLQDYHRIVGNKVSKEWGLPEFVQEACLFYEKPADALGHTNVTQVTHMAHRFAAFLFQPSQEGWDNLMASEVAEELDLSPEYMAGMREQLPQIVELVKSFGA